MSEKRGRETPRESLLLENPRVLKMPRPPDKSPDHTRFLKCPWEPPAPVGKNAVHSFTPMIEKMRNKQKPDPVDLLASKAMHDVVS